MRPSVRQLCIKLPCSTWYMFSSICNQFLLRVTCCRWQFFGSCGTGPIQPDTDNWHLMAARHCPCYLILGSPTHTTSFNKFLIDSNTTCRGSAPLKMCNDAVHRRKYTTGHSPKTTRTDELAQNLQMTRLYQYVCTHTWNGFPTKCVSLTFAQRKLQQQTSLDKRRGLSLG